MSGTLETLLRRIRDGLADADEVVEARRLATHDARLPESLRSSAIFTDEPEADAAALLAVLGQDDLFGAALADAIAAEIGDQPVDAGEPVPGADADRPHVDVAGAVRGEAGRVEITGQVMGALGLAILPVADALAREVGEPPDLSGAVMGQVDAEVLPIGAAVSEEAGGIELAAAVLGELGAEVPPVEAAVRHEAGAPDATWVREVLEAIGIEVLPVAEAVRAEAGTVDVAERVARTLSPEVLAGLLDHQLDATTHRLAAEAVGEDQLGSELTAMADLARDLRNALDEEAGSAPSVWGEVAHAVGIAEPERVEGWDETVLAEAVHHEAGEIDVIEAVQREIGKAPPRSMPLAEIPMESLPPPANRRTWGLGGLVLAAAALLAVFVGPLAGWLPGGDGADGMLLPSGMTFASAQEVVVEDLQYADSVQVFQTEGEGGAVIIWFDEGAVL